MLESGDRFDRYLIEGPIAEGGMGTVYRAFDERLQRRIALKVVWRRPHEDESTARENAARVLREARAAAALSHPNVVAIHDVGEVEGAAFIAMELVSGRTLRTSIATTRPLSVSLSWLRDIARALAAAHRAGLVHRDVKPENVMVTEEGAVKVLDFGIARRAAGAGRGEHGGLGTITSEGSVLGTPLYMAPEQLQGNPVDGRTDQFAWGVVAYELIAGKPPWSASNGFQLIAAILSREPEALTSGPQAEVPTEVVVGTLAPPASPPDPLGPDVPRELEGVILRTLRKDPGDRFVSMDAVVDALDRIEGSAQIARPPGAGPDGDGAGVELPGDGTEPEAPRPSATPASTRPHGRSRLALVSRLLGVAAVLACAVALGVGRLRPKPGPASGSATAAPSVEPASRRARPLPVTANPEALARYREAVQHFHDGAMAEGREDAARAVKLDPGLAAAHLLNIVYEGPYPAKAFRAAFAQRATLDERDQAMLAVADRLFGARPDFAGAARAARELSARFPEDAELVLFEARVAAFCDDHPRAVELALRAADMDPSFGGALNFAGNVQTVLGERQRARKTFERCTRDSPGATTCLINSTDDDAYEGRCEPREAAWRRRRDMNPTHPMAYMGLAWSLESRRAPLGEVRALIQRSVALEKDRENAAQRSVEQLALLAFVRGDFENARAGASAAPRDQASDSSRATAASLEALALIESGEANAAANVAEAYLRERPTFSEPNPFYVVRLVEIALDAGKLTREEALALPLVPGTDESIPESTMDLAGSLRDLALARDATAAAKAVEAVGGRLAKTRMVLYSRLRMSDYFRYQMGRALALAGDVDGAIEQIAPLVRSCPFWGEDMAMKTFAARLLGELLEKKGDTSGACEAYARVLFRWGDAKPRSITADAARSRAGALGCPK